MPFRQLSSTEAIKTIMTVATATAATPIQRDTFVRTAVDSDSTHTRPTRGQAASPGIRRGEVTMYYVHEHHRLHNYPDHCANLAAHTRWNAQSGNDTATGQCIFWVWKQSINHIICGSDHNGHAHSNIYYWRGKDIPIEFNAMFD
eukprot:6479125-Amphidinium_carterae.2